MALDGTRHRPDARTPQDLAEPLGVVLGARDQDLIYPSTSQLEGLMQELGFRWQQSQSQQIRVARLEAGEPGNPDGRMHGLVQHERLQGALAPERGPDV